MVEEASAEKENWDSMMEDIARDLENEFATSPKVPIHDANLRNSIRVTPDGEQVLISMLNYGEYVEFGAPPHMPPVEELKKWVRDKWGEGDSAAWALAMHIKKNGTKPHPFIRPILHSEFPKIIARRKAQYGII